MVGLQPGEQKKSVPGAGTDWGGPRWGQGRKPHREGRSQTGGQAGPAWRCFCSNDNLSSDDGSPLTETHINHTHSPMTPTPLLP